MDVDETSDPSSNVGPLRMRVKRALDVVGAAAALTGLAPVLAVIALCILVLDGRPVFFSQTRIGHRGRPFTMLKFRTMATDAEARRHLLSHHNERTGPLFKVWDDPRITRSGRFLRRTSLDELPQFVNVLRGDMSIVGPRPALPTEVEHFPPALRRREEMPPGITGLWQIHGRTDADFGKYTELDLQYVDEWSLRLDFMIAVRTPAVMLRHASHLRRAEGAPPEPVTTHPDLDRMDEATLDLRLPRSDRDAEARQPSRLAAGSRRPAVRHTA